ncbi:hypothetical protein ACLK1T_18730 [Escherichia coli]
MAGAILFVLGSIGSAFATSVEMLIAARVVLGIAVKGSRLTPLLCIFLKWQVKTFTVR